MFVRHIFIYVTSLQMKWKQIGFFSMLSNQALSTQNLEINH
jgi:hypothetical protein